VSASFHSAGQGKKRGDALFDQAGPELDLERRPSPVAALHDCICLDALLEVVQHGADQTPVDQTA